MPPYAYPITINLDRQIVKYSVDHKIYEDPLTLKILTRIVGDNEFSIENVDYKEYDVTVFKTRYETDEEMNSRIAREQAYMNEYNRRKEMKHSY